MIESIVSLVLFLKNRRVVIIVGSIKDCLRINVTSAEKSFVDGEMEAVRRWNIEGVPAEDVDDKRGVQTDEK